MKITSSYNIFKDNLRLNQATKKLEILGYYHQGCGWGYWEPKKITIKIIGDKQVTCEDIKYDDLSKKEKLILLEYLKQQAETEID